jgi:hypothetical protein
LKFLKAFVTDESNDPLIRSAIGIPSQKLFEVLEPALVRRRLFQELSKAETEEAKSVFFLEQRAATEHKMQAEFDAVAVHSTESHIEQRIQAREALASGQGVASARPTAAIEQVDRDHHQQIASSTPNAARRQLPSGKEAGTAVERC